MVNYRHHDITPFYIYHAMPKNKSCVLLNHYITAHLRILTAIPQSIILQTDNQCLNPTYRKECLWEQ